MDDRNSDPDYDQKGEGGSELTVLSASSINTFLRCGQQWYYAYVLRLKRPPNLKQLLGIAGHVAIETNYKQKIETLMDMSESDVLDAFSDAWDSGVKDSDPGEDNPAEFKESGYESVKLYRRKVAPTIMPQWVEQPIKFKINSIPYSGVIDLVDSLSRIRDHKFVSRRPTDGRSYIINMTGYALAYRHYTLKRETDIVLDH